MTSRQSLMIVANLIGYFAIATIGSATTHATSANRNFTINGAAVTIGQRFDIESKVLGESRRYLVHVPTSYYWGEDRFPVLVVLDASAEFQQTVAAVDFLAESLRIPAMIVVGVSNVDRLRDMTPTASPPQGGGGADKFLSFIAEELLPTIDNSYRTRRYRVLAGHSLGGLFAIHTLQTRPDMFNAYLAISPSVQWDNQSIVKSMESFLKSHPSLQADVYITMGGEIDPMASANKRLEDVFRANAPKTLRWKFARHPDESHNSVPYRSTHEGLQQLFDGYRVSNTDTLDIYRRSGIAGLEARVASESKRLGFSVPMSAIDVGSLFTTMLQEQRFSDVDAILKKLPEWFPYDPVFYEGVTTIYSMLRNDAQAIESGKRWLQSMPGSANARALLEKYKIDVTALVPERSLPKRSLESFVGRYANPAITVDVSIRGDKLFATDDAGTAELKPLSDSEFYFVDRPIKSAFQKDKRGKATGLWMSHNGYRYLLHKVY